MLNLYSQLTSYRGVQYDVNRQQSTESKTITVTYRGVYSTKEEK